MLKWLILVQLSCQLWPQTSAQSFINPVLITFVDTSMTKIMKIMFPMIIMTSKIKHARNLLLLSVLGNHPFHYSLLMLWMPSKKCERPCLSICKSFTISFFRRFYPSKLTRVLHGFNKHRKEQQKEPKICKNWHWHLHQETEFLKKSHKESNFNEHE